jgi:hypothetical protein
MVQHSPERVFFVTQHEFHVGGCSSAEPVVLIEAGLTHRHSAVRMIEVFDRPIGQEAQRVLTPLVPIDQREAVFYPEARPAAIVLDHRHSEAAQQSSEPAARSA